MLRDYQLVSPSLDGVLSHESVDYDNVRRPSELLRIFDGPATKGAGGYRRAPNDDERRELERYFQDLYGVFMKKLSAFVVEDSPDPTEHIKLQALLQEMLKVKKLCRKEEIV